MCISAWRTRARVGASGGGGGAGCFSVRVRVCVHGRYLKGLTVGGERERESSLCL